MAKKKKKGEMLIQEKRRLILNSAVRVFSEKGFHRCRISDIASEAQVAYGLVYHYFDNKEEILNTIFDENWGLLTKVIETVDEQEDRDLRAKLKAIVDFILDAYRLVPDVIQVVVMEIARSSKFLKKPKIDAFEKAFQRLAEIFQHYQEQGQVRKDLDSKKMAYLFFGSIELILTGYLLGTLDMGDEEQFERDKQVITDVCLRGLTA
jgi:TetR/AcrR family transcriptional regulator, fatty acid metabolism regulator protein